MPKITVIMPTFNRAGLISKSIESVLNQSFKDFEFYILDDGSTDNTKEVVEPYLADSRVKYLYHDNEGEAKTVNWGWSLAKGEYFTQVNSDDTITPDSFKIMVKALDKHKDKVLAYPDFNFIDENDKIISTTKNPDWDFKKALSGFACFAASAGSFIRKSAFKDFKEIKRSRFKHINDIEMYWEMALYGDFLHVKHTLANWRVHPGQISAARYKSLPEIEEWFNYYFSKPDLPSKILMLKEKTRESIVRYAIKLIKEGDISKEEKRKLLKPYLEEAGLPVYEFDVLQIGDNDLRGNKFNGCDLSKYLREKGVNSYHLVSKKLSKYNDTFILPLKTGESYTDSIIKDKLFIDSDIVHLHLIHNTNFDINYLPVLTKLKPAVITLHDPFFFGGHCIYPINCDKWKTGCCDCPEKDSRFEINWDYSSYNFLNKKLAIQNSNISAIVASDYMENLVSQSSIWKDKKVYKLPFGINQEIFKPQDKLEIRKKLGIEPDSFVLMLRAIKNPYKGLNLIKEALSILKTDKKITIITVNQKGLLKEFCRKFKIKDFGWVYDDKKLAKLYSACDLFLMPSSREAFGMMAIEAMSTGVPVLSIKGTSLESVTNAPECGVCVEPFEFAAKLQELINNPDEVKSRGEKSYSFAREHYNKEIYVQKMIEIYKDVIKNHKENMDKESAKTIRQLRKYCPEHTNAIVHTEKKNILFSKEISGKREIIRFFGFKIKRKIKNNKNAPK